MSYQTIVYEAVAHIAFIRLNRPDRLNAYTVTMGEELVAAFNVAESDDEVRVVVLTGNGKCFCAGVDLEHLKMHNSDVATTGVKLGEEYFVQGFCKDLLAFPKPLIAAFNGAAIGIGITMSLPCDIRIAAKSAKLGLPFAKLGIVPALGSSYLLPRIVGVHKAKELVFSAKPITAEQALEIGLVNHVVPDDQFTEFTEQLAACRT